MFGQTALLRCALGRAHAAVNRQRHQASCRAGKGQKAIFCRNRGFCKAVPHSDGRAPRNHEN